MELTENQRRAVEYVDGPLLIVAGPGSGKTRVLTQKGIYLIEKKNFEPNSILMTTFTVKASEEIRQRIEVGASKDISAMFIGTIHSFSENIIKQFGGDNYYTEFQVLDDFKRYLFVKRNLKNLGIDLDKLKNLKRVRKENDLIVLITEFFDSLTENLIDDDELKNYVLNQEKQSIIRSIIDYNLKNDVEIDINEVKDIVVSLIDAYQIYVTLMEEHKVLDFCHLQSIAYKIICSNEQVLSDLQNQYRYVLIDEFQDINPLQWKILSIIAKKFENITCVGDKNQSIYGFRGANPNIFEKFAEEFSDVKRIELNDNFRSKKDIVSFAERFLEKCYRKNLDLVPTRDESSEIFYIDGETEGEATEKILSFVYELKQQGRIDSFGDVAILFRSLKYHGAEFIRLLDSKYPDVSYTLYGGSSFLNNEEIRVFNFLLAYIYSIDGKDVVKSLTGFNSIFDLFNSNIFNEEIDEDLSNLCYNSFFKKEDLVEKSFSEGLAGKIVGLNNFRESISEKGSVGIQNAFYKLLGILEILSFEDCEKTKIIYNLGRFSEIIEGFVDIYDRKNITMFFNILHALPENVNLNRKSDEVEIIDTDSLYLMNIHQAKGLEFPVIIVPSLINRRFPNLKKRRALIDIPKKFFLYEPYSPLHEEENLFYVAVTRARDQLLLSYFHRYNSGRSTSKSTFFELIEDLTEEFDSDFDKIEIDVYEHEGIDVKLIDYSAISTFVDCSERFKINYLYGFKAQEIFMQKVGIIYHNALAKVNMDLSKNFNVSDSRVDKILNDSWIDLGKEKNDLFKMKMKSGIKRYVTFMKDDLKSVVGIETPLSMIKDTIRIRGRSDFIYENQKGEIVLMDYKSRTLANINDTHVDLQLMFYADALKRNKQKVDKAVAYPIEEENLSIDDACVSVDDGGEVNEVLEEFVHCIKNNSYCGTKKGNMFCKDCPYRFMCKHFKSVM